MVNKTANAQPVNLDWQGITPGGATARVTTLAHDDLRDYNTESQPEKIKPVVSDLISAKQVFPAYSFTVIEMPVETERENNKP